MPCLLLNIQVHNIPGQGDATNNLPMNMFGQIEDAAASPNDPLFIIHHTMVDCIFDEWLKRHSDAEYPDDELVRDGHRPGDFVRGFFPLFKNEDLFKRTTEFGYSCSLSNLTDQDTDPDTGGYADTLALVTWPFILLVTLFTVVMIH